MSPPSAPSISKMNPFNDTAMDSVARQRLESGLAQIEANMARKEEEKKERELSRDGGQENTHMGRSEQIWRNEENDITSDSLEIRASSKKEKGARRLDRAKNAAKARLRGDRGLKSKKAKDARKRDKSVKKHRRHKDRKALKEKSSKLANDINDHSEDISILDHGTPTASTEGPDEANAGFSKPVQETRIVPVKIGGFWQFHIVALQQTNPDGETNTIPHRSTALLGKTVTGSSPETDSEDDMVRNKRAKTASVEEIITPTPASRVNLAGSLNTQLGNALSLLGRGTSDQQNEPQSPSSGSTTSSSSSSSSLGTSLAAQAYQTFVRTKERARAEDDAAKGAYETVPDTWQDNPGKVRGRLQTSEDTEIEESRQW